MSFGFRNCILRVNLSSGKISTESPGEAFFKKMLGGRNIAGWYLNNEVSGECDPLSPENKIVVAVSIITGAPIPGSSRFTVAAKSPLTEGYGDSEAGGFFGPELKFAGYDAIIIEGKAEKPSYLYITNDTVEIRSAAAIWGKETSKAQSCIREEHSDSKIRVLQTGPAGEKMVRFAALTNDLKHWNGRCGMGAVFGSKNLRAIAVRGKENIQMHNRQAILDYSKWFAQNMKNHESLTWFGQNGTSSLVTILDGMGILPTENFKNGSFEHAKSIDGERINRELLKRRDSCFACPVRCKRVIQYNSDDISIDPAYGGPEYESLGALGSNCRISDMITVCKSIELCGRYGLDTIGTGMTIAFAMECYEKGLITSKDTGGIAFTFGNTDEFISMVEMIAKREGFGDTLAEGSYRAAQKIGNGAEKLAMTSKKMEFAAHEPRGKWNIGLGYAVSPNGADHVVVEHDHVFMGEPNTDKDALTDGDIYPLFKFGIREPLSPSSLDIKKLRLFVILQKLWSLYDVLDLCIFIGEPSRRMTSLEHINTYVNDTTGWDLSLYELIMAGERGYVMGRLFNNKCGITSKDETLPDRMFEPLENGALEGTFIPREEFEEAKTIYYQMTGMDTDGKPLYGKLCELDLQELWS
jgi:aldehyde:ferredoxin oxidoreductase